jgi:hypothetical protein
MFRKLVLGAGLALAALPALAAEGARVQITGEVIDTWCYFSGVMGAPEATLGTAHHTCALWCSAGGIPAGILADDGTVYMVVKWEGSAEVTESDTLLAVQSHRITADGFHFERDGLHYLLVEKVLADEGIVNLTHEDYGITPAFAFPDPKQ